MNYNPPPPPQIILLGCYLIGNTNRIVPYWTFGDADSNAAIIDIGQ